MSMSVRNLYDDGYVSEHPYPTFALAHDDASPGRIAMLVGTKRDKYEVAYTIVGAK